MRDRLGVKPLYYYPTKHGVLFGSEPKVILANGLAERAMDADGLRRTLCSLADPGNTVFCGMREVRPGHIARVTRDGIQQIAYWQLTDSGHTDDVPTTVRRVRELLEDTIQRQLIADVPLCTLLSGGLDSSALTALAARFSDKRVRSFALDFVDYTNNFTPGPMCGTPDGPYVQEVAKFVGTDHTDITLSADELMDQSVRAATLRARDLPLTSGDIDSSQYLLFRSDNTRRLPCPGSRPTRFSAVTRSSTISRTFRPTHFLDTAAGRTSTIPAGSTWTPRSSRSSSSPATSTGSTAWHLRKSPA